MRARYLVDKSALARMPIEAVRSRLAPIIEAGEAATCAIVDLEVLFSARNYEEHERIRRRRSLAYDSVPITESTLQRAIDVQAELPDLIIAAAAEAAGLIVLHYDRDYDLIAEITHQPTEWVVERGSI